MKYQLILVTALLFFFNQSYALSVPPSVSPQWLKKNLNQDNLAIIEVSDKVDFTFNGHIPGSVVTNKGAWRFQDSDGSLVRLPVDKLEEKVRQLGIGNNDAVVIYYKGNNSDEILGAFYLYWLFHLMGHTNVGVLDTGWHGWLDINGPIEETSKAVQPGDFVAQPLLALEVKTDELNAIRKHYLLIDGRPAGHFKGITKFDANPRYGRIPGSLSQPWKDYMREAKNGMLYAKAPKIPKLLARLKIDPDTPILLTCLGGTGAAFNYAMFYAAGFRNMRLDDAALRRWNTRRLPLENTDMNESANK